MLRGNQRRAVLEPSPGSIVQVDGRFGQHLRLDPQIRRHRQAGEGPVIGQRRQGHRLSPTHGAAKSPSAAAQPHRQQVVGIVSQLGAGQTDHHPSLVDPGPERLAVGIGQTALIGHDDQRQFPLQQVGDAAAPDLGHRRQCAVAVVQVVEQRRRTAAAVVDQADRPPLPTAVEQGDGPGRALSFDLQAGHPVAQFGRHRQAQLRLRHSGRHGEDVAGQGATGGIGGADGDRFGRTADGAPHPRRQIGGIGPRRQQQFGRGKGGWP